MRKGRVFEQERGQVRLYLLSFNNLGGDCHRDRNRHDNLDRIDRGDIPYRDNYETCVLVVFFDNWNNDI